MGVKPAYVPHPHPHPGDTCCTYSTYQISRAPPTFELQIKNPPGPAISPLTGRQWMAFVDKSSCFLAPDILILTKGKDVGVSRGISYHCAHCPWIRKQQPQQKVNYLWSSLSFINASNAPTSIFACHHLLDSHQCHKYQISFRALWLIPELADM